MPKQTVSANLFLASQSPRRSELLSQIGVRFRKLSVSVKEQKNASETAVEYVNRLAREKAQAGFTLIDPAQNCVLGADTIVVCDERVLEKPIDGRHGCDMLLTLSARSHWVYTSVAIVNGQGCYQLLGKTKVLFRTISPQEADQYWQTGEPLDKAGGYGIQGFGGVFVERIEGSYSNVVGLPIFETEELLRRVGVPIWGKDLDNE